MQSLVQIGQPRWKTKEVLTLCLLATRWTRGGKHTRQGQVAGHCRAPRPLQGRLSETVRHQTKGRGACKAGSTVMPHTIQSVAVVEPGPLQNACPNTGTLGRAEVSVAGVSMEMIVEHGHNDTAFGSNACCPRPSNSFPPSQVDSFCALSVLVCVTWRVD